tara:strand:+ start:947 stop:1522 length:576 start_codon:yes stop_codon:yes gene_type:complete
MINLVLLGKPGAGKGTQAEFLKSQYQLFHLSTGDLFRHHIQGSTDLGMLAKSYMDKGDLVPDQITIDIMKETVKENSDVNGFIFDGFPRTTAQADALDNFLLDNSMKITATIALEAADDVLLERLVNRGMTSGRVDDQDQTSIRNRFEEYNNKTAPLKTFYTAQGKFHSVNGIGSVEEVTQRLIRLIDRLI